MDGMETSEAPATNSCVNTDRIPYSYEYFQALSTPEIVVYSIAVALACVTLSLSAGTIWYIIRTYTNNERKALCCGLVGLQAVFAVTSAISYGVPRAKIFCDMVSSVYLSASLWLMCQLMFHYHGGTDAFVAKTEGETVRLRSLPVCCLCFCLPNIALSRKNLLRLKIFVLQYTCLIPLIVFVTGVIWSEGKLVVGRLDPTQAFLYLTVARVCSTLLAMYGLNVLLRASMEHLRQVNIRPKFICLQLVLVLSNFQAFIFRILSRANIPPCYGILSSQTRSDGIHYLLMVLEMSCLAVVAWYYYRQDEKSNDVNSEKITTSQESEHAHTNIASFPPTDP